MPSLKERLTAILIDNKLISQEQLDKALDTQKQKGGRLSDIIVSLNFIKESELSSVLSRELGLPLIDLKRFKINLDVAKSIPVEIAQHYQILPVSRMGDTITLAMADPLNILAIDHVQSLTGFKINPVIATSQEIIQAIETCIPDSSKGTIDSLVQEVSSSIELIKQEEDASLSDQELSKLSRDTPVIKITNMILEEAIKKRSSDILIEPLDKRLRIRYRIDGVLREEQSPPKSMHASIISRIKVISELNIAEHRMPQDGRFKVKLLGREVDFRVSVLPTNLGEKCALRVLDKSQALLNLEKLGFNEKAVSVIHKTAKLPHGMVLVCGPTGSGKTTTLYSVLKYVDSPQKNIVTVEDPVEYQLQGINQVTVRSDIGLTFAAALRSILRQDPNVIMIGEIRDFETVDIAVKSALTGHLVLSTLHTTTAPGAIVRLVNMGVEPYLINASVVCILSQRLLRRVCQNCKEEVVYKKDVLESLRIDLDSLAKSLGGDISGGNAHVFLRGKGCSRCFNSGYSGRVGIAEILLLSTKIRELILQRAQESLIKSHARQEGMMTLREEGLRLAFAGETTLEEVVRATVADEK